MNKIIIMSLFLFSAVFLSNFLESSAHKKIHNNSILFYGDVDTHAINFKITDHCISPGQPYENTVGLASKSQRIPPKNIIETKRGLNIKAGRHGSVRVVDCLNNHLLNGYAVYNKLTFAKKPHHLNFAVIGTLSINGKYFDNIVLAQGHTMLSNNWWFGGRKCVIYTKPNKVFNSVTCTARDNTQWCFTRGQIGRSLLKYTARNEVKVNRGECSKAKID